MAFYSLYDMETFCIQYMIQTRDEHARAERTLVALREELNSAEVAVAEARESFRVAVANYHDARARIAREREAPGFSPENPIVIE